MPPKTSVDSYLVFPSTILKACHRSAFRRNLGSSMLAQATRWFTWSTVVMISNADCDWNHPGSSIVGGRCTGAMRRYWPSAGVWSGKRFLDLSTIVWPRLYALLDRHKNRIECMGLHEGIPDGHGEYTQTRSIEKTVSPFLVIWEVQNNFPYFVHWCINQRRRWNGKDPILGQRR